MANKTSHPSKERAYTAIKHHLLTNGPGNWKVILNQFPEVAEVTMWRWIRDAKGQPPDRGALVIGKNAIAERMREKGAVVDKTAEFDEFGEIALHLPAAPVPATVSRQGTQAIRNIDFAVEIHKLYADAMLLRAYTVKTGDDGVETIKNPVLFERQISRRTSLLETTLRTMQEMWDLRTMQGFYEAIIEEVAQESPECQKRILERLQKLNQERGMTMFMKV
ncbi:MAG: hypothetical protein AB9M53_01200 [Leptothrix sp. (in: b-proteobacteria)]